MQLIFKRSLKCPALDGGGGGAVVHVSLYRYVVHVSLYRYEELGPEGHCVLRAYARERNLVFEAQRTQTSGQEI